MATSTAPIFSNAARRIKSVPYGVAAATQIWYGQALMVSTSTGLVQPCADLSGYLFVGFANESVNNTADLVGGAVSVGVNAPTIWGQTQSQVNATSPTVAAWVGQHVFWTDDHTVALAAGSTNKLIAGKVLSVDATGASGRVTIDHLFFAAYATS